MIIRRQHNGSFTQIGNDILDDDRLSLEAVGLLAYLLSKPHDWEVRLPQLRKRAKIGRDKLRRIIAELVRFGYMLRKKVRDAAGSFIGEEFIVYDEPQRINEPDIERGGEIDDESDDDPAPENPSLGQPAPGLPAPEKASLAVYKDSTNTEDSTKTDSHQVEREARAGAKEPDPDSDPDFQALLAKVVKAAGPQPVGRTFPLWRKLDDDAMRKAALEGWDTCLAEWSKGGRKHPYGLETYLRDRLWTQAQKTSAEGGPKVILELRSGEWFAHFWGRFLAGDLQTCRTMITMAKMRVGSSVPADAVPSSSSFGAMPRIDKSSEAWRAWRQKLHAAGLLVDDDMIPAWVWVPSEWPKGMEPDAMERQAG